ncbi:hypothetical protein F3J37_01020 [Pantoea sp. Al-1710]|uniref:Peptidase S74 domain-containing protein n=1 Tax=Candidatus Pantoea communis TaxID=2608354 RepID=A0ABX0RHZ3_9GAMM|nr:MULTISPECIES: tail fiber domain-containing protein [Pantoea]NIG13042.1 hypothetical protein [Pantoea sp. Cy-640]NIG17257.1 hypothetical protein [Pantoea communis]
MPSGTITVTNASTTITGDGTTFTTDVNAGDYISFAIGGVQYTYPVATVDSDSSLTIAMGFNGTTTSSLTYEVVPITQLIPIPASLVNQTTQALRGNQTDRDNWNQLLTVDDDVTITNPDGTTFTGPSWLKVAEGINLTDLDQVTAIASQIQANADAASTSETNAANSASAAATSESNAATSEQNAATSETNAAQSATDAQTSLDSIGDSVTQAAESASAASDSASAAATSENNAANSASAASTSEQNAATSEQNASTSESNAASSESNASDSADASAQSASDAADSATSAATSETNASNSAIGLSAAVSSAAQSASDASDSADRAEAAAADLENNNALAATIDHIDTDTNDVYFKGSLISGYTSTDPSEMNAAFVLANEPVTGDVVNGGVIKTSIIVGDDEYLSATIQTNVTVGNDPTVDIVLTDSTGDETSTKSWSMPNTEGQLLNLDAAGMSSASDTVVNFKGSVGVTVDASRDTELVTLRQLNTALAGVGGDNGATLNGVMNNLIGGVVWVNGARGVDRAGHLPADGQELTRTDYPDLWAAVEAGLYASIDEITWQSSASNRGYYSTGDGSTTFRLPDLNGRQSGSTQGIFLRGDEDGMLPGEVRTSAIPNISGSLGNLGSNLSGGATSSNQGSGVLMWSGITAPTYAGTGTSPSSSGLFDLNFNASRGSSIYKDNLSEVRPPSVSGMWLIRVNGSFVSSDTNFNVINAIDALPDSGVVVNGGDLQSVYQVDGSDYVVARLRSQLTVGTIPSAMIEIIDSSGDTVTTDQIQFDKTGMVYREASGAGSDNNRTGGHYRSETTQSFGQMYAYRNSADGGLVFQVSQDSEAVQSFFMTGEGHFVTPGQIDALTGPIQAVNGEVVTATTAPSSPTNGNYLNTPAVKALLIGRGARGDTRGGFFGMYHQEEVGVMARGIFNLNGYGTDWSWSFNQDETTSSPLGQLTAGGSDRRMKTNIQPTTPGAGERIDQIEVIEFEWIRSGIKERGCIAQQVQEIDELYTHLNGENIDSEGNKFTVLNVRDRAILADVVVCVQELRTQVKDLNSSISSISDELKAEKEKTKSLIAALGYLADGDNESFKENLNELRGVHI